MSDDIFHDLLDSTRDINVVPQFILSEVTKEDIPAYTRRCYVAVVPHRQIQQFLQLIHNKVSCDDVRMYKRVASWKALDGNTLITPQTVLDSINAFDPSDIGISLPSCRIKKCKREHLSSNSTGEEAPRLFPTQDATSDLVCLGSGARGPARQDITSTMSDGECAHRHTASVKMNGSDPIDLTHVSDKSNDEESARHPRTADIHVNARCMTTYSIETHRQFSLILIGSSSSLPLAPSVCTGLISADQTDLVYPLFAVDLPCLEPRTQELYDALQTYWPLAYHPSKINVFPHFTVLDQLIIPILAALVLRLAHEAYNYGLTGPSAVIFHPTWFQNAVLSKLPTIQQQMQEIDQPKSKSLLNAKALLEHRNFDQQYTLHNPYLSHHGITDAFRYGFDMGLVATAVGQTPRLADNQPGACGRADTSSSSPANSMRIPFSLYDRLCCANRHAVNLCKDENNDALHSAGTTISRLTNCQLSTVTPVHNLSASTPNCSGGEAPSQHDIQHDILLLTPSRPPITRGGLLPLSGCLQHATMLAIDKLSATQRALLDRQKHSCPTPPTLEANGPLSHAQTAHVDDLFSNIMGPSVPFLANEHDLYLSHEPCAMCAMAALHSRFKRVFFLFPSPASGMVASCYTLQQNQHVNHRYSVYHLRIHPQ